MSTASGSPGSHRQSHLRTETNGGITLVHFVDSKIVSEDAIHEVGEELYALVDQYNYKNILLNFSYVQFLSSAALGKLIQLKKKVISIRGQLKLCCIHPDLFEVFRITRLDQVFAIYPEEDDALKSFESN